LVASEQFICTACLLELPETNFHLRADNTMEKVFWGRAKIEKAIALLYYKKGGKMSKLLFALKYKDNSEIAVFLGRYYGSKLLPFIRTNKIDAVVAIPLHKRKQKMRGYNQSAMLAKGMSETLQIADLSNYVQRNKFTETQTKKTRIERSDNVSSVFGVLDKKVFEGKHVLLIDDVITTGATIESCANELLLIKDLKLSIASLAFAHNGV
jgi:ComF family protein